LKLEMAFAPECASFEHAGLLLNLTPNPFNHGFSHGDGDYKLISANFLTHH